MYRKSGEFSFIETVENMFLGLVPSGVEGIGDDCAVIPQGDDRAMVVTTDMLGEGIHFLNGIDPYALGVRSVQVNISDVVAMGAEPCFLLLSVGVPEWVGDDWLMQFMKGIHSCGVALIGGDTTRSSEGLSISVTAIGEAPTKNIKRRSGAKAGDLIFVSGELGESAYNSYSSEVWAEVEEGVWLGGRSEVTSMMDISDGLSGDICHIMECSGVGATIELESVPVYNGATLEQALSGGEDFKLLFTVSPEGVEALKEDFRARFSRDVFCVGEIISTEELRYTRGGVDATYSGGGFVHF
ncbi:MAG: thiamine-phosphate kinase [Rikenellaceae bacterium]